MSALNVPAWPRAASLKLSAYCSLGTTRTLLFQPAATRRDGAALSPRPLFVALLSLTWQPAHTLRANSFLYGELQFIPELREAVTNLLQSLQPCREVEHRFVQSSRRCHGSLPAIEAQCRLWKLKSGCC